MDLSTIRCSFTQEWTVDGDGACQDLIAQSPRNWSCTAHASQPYVSWEAVVAHLTGPQHNPEAQAAQNGGVPSDVTQVMSFHAVELETPDVDS